MRKQQFIDAVYAAGWKSDNDAQHRGISKVWEQLFPSLADLEKEVKEMIESAHMAGQSDAGVDPSYCDAFNYASKTLKNK